MKKTLVTFFKAWGGIFLLAILLSTVFLSPLLLHLRTQMASQEDCLLVSWTIKQVMEAVLHGRSIYQLPFFYPYPNTLAYSEPFLSTAILNIPLSWFSQSLIVSQNVHLFGGTVIMFLASYVLGKELFRSKISALAVASIFTFSSLHFGYYFHLHVYLLAGLPIAVYGLLKWLETDKWWFLALCCTAFLYQAGNAATSLFFVAFVLLIVCLNKEVWKILWNRKQKVLLAGIVTCSIVAVFYFPYVQVSHQLHFVRSIRDVAHQSASINQLFTWEIALLIALYTLLYFTNRKNSFSPSPAPMRKFLGIRQIGIIVVTGFLLMLGPVLKVNNQTFKIGSFFIPLPYVIPYYLFPGFQSMRSAGRWTVVLGFGVALLYGYELSRSRFRPEVKLALVIFLLSFFWLSQVPQMTHVQVNQNVPAIYQLVAQQPESVMVELPVYHWPFPGFYHEDYRLYYQLTHGKKIYNGISGLVPDQRKAEYDLLFTHFPEDQTLEIFRKQGVPLVLIHWDEYQALYDSQFIYSDTQTRSLDPQLLQQQVKQQSHLHLISCQDQKCLYRLQ
jgi:hypothetical protein